ncbi:MAG: hypothetical protein WCW13_03020 [archaeon]
MQKFNSKGQFFSPDLTIAVGVFIFGLALFLNASNSIFLQSDLLDARKEADEVAHRALNSLVLSSGSPSNWQDFTLSDINSFGLAKSPNFIDVSKISALILDLNSDVTYSSTKTKLGMAPYDFYFRFLDEGVLMNVDGLDLVGGRVAIDPKVKLTYQRIVYVNGHSAVFEAIVSLSK